VARNHRCWLVPGAWEPPGRCSAAARPPARSAPPAASHRCPLARFCGATRRHRAHPGARCRHGSAAGRRREDARRCGERAGDSVHSARIVGLCGAVARCQPSCGCSWIPGCASAVSASSLSAMPRTACAAERTDSYLICGTPRTGSTLLCGLLESTGVAGHPESYFRQPDERSWAARWGIACSPGGAFSYADYVQAGLAEGRTENGVFAARIMWGTLEEVAGKLRTIYRDLPGGDVSLLNRAFGRTRFVYLRRGDVLRQAVSWLRAEQTGVWFQTDEPGQDRPEQELRFDFGRIHELAQLISEHNAAWQEWFASAGVRPHPVRYEDLDADPVGVTRDILDFLGIELPPGREISARHRRLADELNAEWIERYRAEPMERWPSLPESPRHRDRGEDRLKDAVRLARPAADGAAARRTRGGGRGQPRGAGQSGRDHHGGEAAAGPRPPAGGRHTVSNSSPVSCPVAAPCSARSRPSLRIRRSR
jgi:trehalose 2-sulfotransferase